MIRDVNAKRTGAIRGIPNPADADSLCYYRRETKINPTHKYLKEKYGDSKIIQYIGYTKGEGRSIKDTQNITYKYPLKHIFKMTEDDCKKYLIDQEMENPLYRYFSRTGCGFCPFQSERSMYQIYYHFNEIWQYMKWVEKRLYEFEKMGYEVINKHWFTENRTIKQMEYIFNQKQNSLFDFSDDPIKDCFCKI